VQVAGEGGGFARYAFHHAAIAADGVDVVIEHLEFGAVEVSGHPLAGQRHTDAGSHALAKGPVVVSMPEVQRYSG